MNETGDLVLIFDHEVSQFYKIEITPVHAMETTTGTISSPIILQDDNGMSSTSCTSVFEMIKSLPLQSNLMVALSQVQNIVSVLELPVHYDGYIAFELPPQGEQPTMHGMEQRFDGHCWTEYVTCSSDLFKGVVCFSRCGGHLQCVNID